jgi:hypothetical protein
VTPDEQYNPVSELAALTAGATWLEAYSLFAEESVIFLPVEDAQFAALRADHAESGADEAVTDVFAAKPAGVSELTVALSITFSRSERDLCWVFWPSLDRGLLEALGTYESFALCSASALAGGDLSGAIEVAITFEREPVIAALEVPELRFDSAGEGWVISTPESDSAFHVRGLAFSEAASARAAWEALEAAGTEPSALTWRLDTTIWIQSAEATDLAALDPLVTAFGATTAIDDESAARWAVLASVAEMFGAEVGPDDLVDLHPSPEFETLTCVAPEIPEHLRFSVTAFGFDSAEAVEAVAARLDALAETLAEQLSPAAFEAAAGFGLYREVSASGEAVIFAAARTQAQKWRLMTFDWSPGRPIELEDAFVLSLLLRARGIDPSAAVGAELNRPTLSLPFPSGVPARYEARRA